MGIGDAAEPFIEAALGDTPGPVGCGDYAAGLAHSLPFPVQIPGCASRSNSVEFARPKHVRTFDEFTNQERIAEAVALFEATRASTTPPGKASLAKLQGYLSKGEIEFGELPPSQLGWSKDDYQNLFSAKVKVNNGLRPYLLGVAITLAHEGLHRFIDRSSLDEEIACFELGNDVYQELKAGVMYISPVTHQMVVLDLEPMDFDESIAAARKKRRLVDLILTFGTDYPKLVTTEWVIRNFKSYGGIGNRTAATKGIFLDRLGSDDRNEQLILQILSSIKTPQDWQEVKKAAPNLEANGRLALRHIVSAPTIKPHILAIQNLGHIDLGARVDPPPRKPAQK